MSGAIYNDFTQFTTLRAEATKLTRTRLLEEVAAQFESIFSAANAEVHARRDREK